MLCSVFDNSHFALLIFGIKAKLPGTPKNCAAYFALLIFGIKAKQWIFEIFS